MVVEFSSLPMVVDRLSADIFVSITLFTSSFLESDMIEYGANG